MNFDDIVFREELIESEHLADPEWTLPDGLIFRKGKEHRSDDSFFQFIITGTSHTPFRFSTEDYARTFFPEARDRNRLLPGGTDLLPHK